MFGLSLVLPGAANAATTTADNSLNAARESTAVPQPQLDSPGEAHA